MSEYVAQLLDSTTVRSMRRLAVVIEGPGQSFVLQAVRDTVPCYAVETLPEFRGALGEQLPGAVLAVDVRAMARGDVELLAAALSPHSSTQGLVYVLTRAQLSLFAEHSFDFVYRSEGVVV